ncbi:uncharacterized protein GGS22DRAFT_199113 [Annulohypoxylon maeteangense]|uniref:uncharacterized protein n=1 Tax=Annulohypoxylon maeteangense TaxID=1927788 RepID=UPI0020075FDF|nr:uncharacterized protein GGS22DRAFT_199113 [Annulohypoxylon maeteangense]KAI0886751.1 hypothetical protein GGS22DRAFT_199113 [Annulohypoxylon maeteangense]
MGGVFQPPWFVAVRPNKVEMNLSSIVAGISICTGIFSFAKGVLQTRSICAKKNRPNAYVVMVWIEWSVCITMGIICWLYLWGTIPPSFQFFFLLVTLWVFQTQCLIQIIINRIALLVPDQTQIIRMKWGIGIVFGLINLSVYLIWIPARLQINETYIKINDIWDRIEKGIFCMIDVALNVYFIYLVRSGLISNGLTKYMPLFIFNIIMLTFSLSLDIILIGVMSLGQIYFQFHPFVYLLKLYIEMNITDLIAKIVREDNRVSYASKTFATKAGAAAAAKFNGTGTLVCSSETRLATPTNNTRYSQELQEINSQDDNPFKANPNCGIRKTVVTEVQHVEDLERQASRINNWDSDSPRPPPPCLRRHSSIP